MTPNTRAMARRWVATISVLTASLLAFGSPHARAANATSAILGRWGSTVNWESQGGLIYTLDILPGGRLHQRVGNKMGMAYDLYGNYVYNAATSTFRWEWNDYGPHMLCLPVSGCRVAPKPNDPMHQWFTSHIIVQNPNFFIGIFSDGSRMNWTRER